MSAEGQQEPSMEDILASIRKILSEDDGEAAKAEPAQAAPAPQPEPEPMPEPEPEPEPEQEPLVMTPEPEPEPEEDMPLASIFDDEPEAELQPVAEPEDQPLHLTGAMMVEEEQHQPMYEPQPQHDYGHGYQQQDQGYPQHLVSDPVAEASSASISHLANAVARERAIALGQAGITLEQLVREICTPILKHWLDTNLPYMVERIVKQEIERIVNRSERM